LQKAYTDEETPTTPARVLRPWAVGGGHLGSAGTCPEEQDACRSCW
jgi:hypothetical protein